MRVAPMFRIANLRRSQILELSAKVIYSRFEIDDDGETQRRFYDLPLERREVTFFPLSWTVVHAIDEASPLRGEGEESCRMGQAEFLVLLSGIDESFSQPVQVRTSYLSDDVIWNARFRRIFELTTDGPRVVSIDVSRIHEWERVEPEATE